MAHPDATDVRDALAQIPDPSGAGDIVSTGRVKGVTCAEGRAGFVVELRAGEDPKTLEALRASAQAAVAAVPGVTRVAAVMTAHNEAPGARGSSQPGAAPPPLRPAAPGGRIELPGVAAIVAVASGKGGVGKSTVAANLACALARRGRRVGLLDADVYGPSAPILFGLEGERPKTNAERQAVPLEAYGVKVMSVGFVASAEEAMIWRGPIATGMIGELLGRVAWGPLDVLVIDMPPGTGDVQLTLTQRAPISGAVIVSTPQKLALADVRRGIQMFAKVHVPIFGVVENMSAAPGTEPGTLFAPFGMDGAKIAAEALGVPFLGALPLDPQLAYDSDEGRPPAACAPESPSGARFLALADAVLAALAAGATRAAPEIVFE
jgi:ATP-binding protein involved in chromosome partitioning